MTAEGHVEKTVLFADIAGSTRLYAQLGDDATRRLLSDCLDLMESVVAERGGHVSRRIGDEILCTFPTPDDAAMAAMRMQSQVSEGDASGRFATPMRIRVGFEHGEIIEAPDALYGHVVHTAARVASRAKARQILTTARTLGMLNPVLRRFTRYSESAVLKGQSGEQEIHEILWNVQDTTMKTTQRKKPAAAPRGALRVVEIEYRGRVYRADAERPRLEIGRDPACDVSVTGEAVSQHHAVVHWDRNGVHIEDESTNGTYIEQSGAERAALHHARAPLRGEGVLRFGDPDDPARGASVRYVSRTESG